jgi:hypothetical protein
MKKSFDPLQFDFRAHWLFEIRALRDRPMIQLAVEEIKDYYADIAECKYEDAREFDEEQAKAEYELDLHTAEVKCFDLPWLRETFEGCDLIKLVLAIAQELHPEKKFEILEDDERAILTDLDRTIVFDIKNFDRMSAKASLLLLNDQTFSNDELGVREVENYLGQRNEETLKILEALERTVAEPDTQNVIILDERR